MRVEAAGVRELDSKAGRGNSARIVPFLPSPSRSPRKDAVAAAGKGTGWVSGFGACSFALQERQIGSLLRRLLHYIGSLD